jgi:biopolymer transport protein ExbD
MNRRRTRASRRSGMKADSLSSMVDIVFLLLAFFILASAITPRDTESKLDCSRPATDEETHDVPVEFMRVVVERDGVALNGRRYQGSSAIASLHHQLAKLAVFSKQMPVRVACMPDSPHRLLVGVLNALNQAEYTTVGVCSL